MHLAQEYLLPLQSAWRFDLAQIGVISMGHSPCLLLTKLPKAEHDTEE
jgi:hypothetical protein